MEVEYRVGVKVRFTKQKQVGTLHKLESFYSFWNPEQDLNHTVFTFTI